VKLDFLEEMNMEQLVDLLSQNCGLAAFTIIVCCYLVVQGLVYIAGHLAKNKKKT
jgi:hypothetical protein